MGQPKLLLPWGQRTVIEHVLAAWSRSRVSHVVVVVHPADHELAETCRRAGAEVVVAPAPPADMKASVLYGLEFVGAVHHPATHDVWLLAPADMPLVSTASIDAVLAGYIAGQPRIIAPRHAGRRGHPVLFPWALAPEVRRLAPAEGLNQLVKSHPMREIEVADGAVLTDFDTPDDYSRLRERHGPRE